MASFYDFIREFHSGWAYLVLFLSVFMLGLVLYHYFTKKPLQRNIRKIFFYTVLTFHIQFLVGVILYIVSPLIRGYWSMESPMGVSEARLYIVEHPLMMFTAVILVTIANAKLKKSETVQLSSIIFLVIALLCFYMIPWTQWLMT